VRHNLKLNNAEVVPHALVVSRNGRADIDVKRKPCCKTEEDVVRQE
ncbi:hypothetical protein A2U01_0089079, partial [Trifolium medium]|nr:hypothetical protein [Trifolium medium]